MKIGIDIDGVLADFIPAYQRLVIEHAGGLNLFKPNDDKQPPCWNWPEFRGYDSAVVSRVWEHIITSSSFWMYLNELEGCSTLRMVILDLLRNHDVYFITARPGLRAKQQTEQWLIKHLGIERPTVLISSAKGLCAEALKLDCYIDDNLDNAYNVIQTSPKTRMYLLDMRYNQTDVGPGGYARVKSVGQFLDAELARL